jgi:DmsE family decaheme c-type cytochrome
MTPVFYSSSRSSDVGKAPAGRKPQTGAFSRLFVCTAAATALAYGQEVKLPDGYAGSESCGTCHEDIVKGFKNNRHSVLDKSKDRGWTARACEGCHGPGAKHAESASADDIRNPLKLTTAAADRNCLGCHQNKQTNAGRIASSHVRGEVPCTACHNVHPIGEKASSAKLATAKGINQTCSRCHTAVWASFQKPHRHALPESVMSCTSCHNPHGAFQPRMLRTSIGAEPGCLKCHTDKRGPFVYEHAPLRLEPCTICHEPHGSTNPRMLTRHEVGFQCLECHSNLISPGASGTVGGLPPAIHDIRNPRFKNCTLCHQKPHGSNVNRTLLR